jgi:phage gpG-like protein
MTPPVITLSLTTAAQRVLRRMTDPMTVLRPVAAALDRQNELSIGYIVRNKLSRRGPTTLGVRTGLLRRSLRRSKATIHGRGVRSAIGTNVAYAGVHEFGFDGNVTVRAHTRRIRSRDVQRRSGNDKRGGLAASGVAFIRSHSRHMSIPARAPIQTGIRERIADYSKAISKAIVEAFQRL